MLSGIRVVFYPMPDGRLGHGPTNRFILTSVHMSAGAHPSDQVDPHLSRYFTSATATTNLESHPASLVLDHRRINGWAPGSGGEQHITLTLQEPLDAKDAAHVTVMLNFGAGSNEIAGHFEVFAFEGTDDGAHLDMDTEAALRIAPDSRTDDDWAQLRAAWARSAASAANLRHAETNLEERLAVLTTPFSTMVMSEALAPRPTHLLHRGQYDQPRERVLPGVPSILPALPGDSSLTRLDFADWLFTPDHPLTARVAVNRFWQLLFGRGLVATPADFGMRGALPSHPQLLDYLATEFVQSGYDVKTLLKRIVMSATYRQSSEATPELLAADPHNEWLARGARYRLPAEFIRDGALTGERAARSAPRRPQRTSVPAARTLEGGEPLRQHAGYRPDLCPGPRRKALPAQPLHLLEAYGTPARHDGL